MLYGFSTITAWIAVAGAALWGVLSSKISIRWSWAISLLITGIACLFWGHAASPAVYFVYVWPFPLWAAWASATSAP